MPKFALIHNIVQAQDLDLLKETLDRACSKRRNNKKRLKFALDAVVKRSWLEGLQYLLARSDFEENCIKTLYLLKTAIERENSPISQHLLSDPRFYRKFQAFTDEHIQELWGTLHQDEWQKKSIRVEREENGYYYADWEEKPYLAVSWKSDARIFALRILIHLFKQDPHLTYDEVTQQLAQFDCLDHSDELFKIAKKISLHPDALVFCFGLDFLENFFSMDSILPVLKDESEDVRFVHAASHFRYPLHIFLERFYLEEQEHFFNLLLNSKKININKIRSDYQDTVLILAIHTGNMRAIRLLLAHPGIELSIPYAPFDLGDTPLHLVMQKNRTDILELLLQHERMTEALVNDVNAEYKTPLMRGIDYGSVDACRRLLQDHRLTCFTSIAYNLENLLHCVILGDGNAKAMLPLLLVLKNKGISEILFQAEDRKGRTPFFTAVQMNDHQSAEMLLFDSRMDVNQTFNGITPLYWAVERHNRKAVNYLLEKDVDVNGVTEDGKTALHLAAKHFEFYPEIFLDLFFHSKTDPNQVDKNGSTPWHIVLTELCKLRYRSYETSQDIRFKQLINEHASAILNDPRFNISIGHEAGDSLLELSIEADHIINFYFLNERVKQETGERLRMLDPKINHKEFLDFYKNSPNITIFSALWKLLNENQENKYLTYEAVFEKLKKQDYPDYFSWLSPKKSKKTAFESAQYLLFKLLPAMDLFSQVDSLKNDSLKVKNAQQRSEMIPQILKESEHETGIVEVEEVLEKQARFFTMMKKIASIEEKGKKKGIEIATSVCRAVYR